MDNKKLLIFDMDGTLLDSMGYWTFLGRIYLESKGKLVQDNLEEKISVMTLEESALYLKEEYNLEEDIDTIQHEVMNLIKDKYKNEIQLKEGAKSYLEKMKSQGHRMCILTTCEKNSAKSALARLKVLDLFEKIYTDKDFKMSKLNPNIYIKVYEDMNVKVDEVVVYEDALHAIESAKKTGYKVIGVYDEYSKSDWQQIKNIANYTIKNFD